MREGKRERREGEERVVIREGKTAREVQRKVKTSQGDITTGRFLS